jgi:hypothetical protein
MHYEQRKRVHQRLRERIAQMPEGPAKNRLHDIRLRLALGESARSIHETNRDRFELDTTGRQNADRARP